MANPPVGEVCSHRQPEVGHIGVAPYDRDDEDRNIYYHGYFLQGGGHDMKLLICGKPEPWRWKLYERECGGCGKIISNPWVPVCKDCWDSQSPYPSWNWVIALDILRKGL